SSGAPVQSARSDFDGAAAMDVRSASDGDHLGVKYLFGYDEPGSWWHSAGSEPLLTAHTGDDCAWLGVKAHFAGSLLHGGPAASERHDTTPAATPTQTTAAVPVGESAAAPTHTTAAVPSDGSATAPTSVDHGAIDTGGNSAGNGGDGYFYGSMVHAPVVIYA